MTDVGPPDIRIVVTREGENIKVTILDSNGDTTFNLSRLVADRLGIKLVMLANIDVAAMGET